MQSIQQLFGATASSYRHNDVIYRQGDPVSCFFLVMEGHVKLVSIGASGDEFIKSILPVGEYFGPGVAFDTHALCEEMAIARGITRILPIPSDAMEYSSDKAGELNAGLIRSLAKQKRFQERRLERMRLGDMRCRVAGMLQTLAVHYGGPCMHGHAIDFRMTQDELANLVGASRQVVSGILSEFKALGIIGYTRSYICIEDMDRLEIRIEY
ncbi:MAG: Crp/Fnr family transcriptional regulator [Gammaproteobacteria bacterium]|nr:Crp/Fnr family transcriptional regulator [Gammaproteobacteria bacterium]